MKILWLPIIPFHPLMVQRPHHLAASFGRAGHTVSYIDAHRRSPVPVAKDVCMGVTEHRIEHSMYQDFKHDRVKSGSMARSLAALKPDIIVVNAPYWADVARRVKSMSGARLVYDILDYFQGFEDLVVHGDRLEAAHQSLVKNADLVTHTAMNLKPDDHPNTLYLPNACEFEHWDLPCVPGGRAGYFGSLAYWFDHDLIEGLDVDLIGHGSKRGMVAYTDIPGFTYDWGCGLIPFKDVPLTRSTNPVKLYEYMALGLPVVATDLEEIRFVADQMPEDIRPTLAGPDDDWAVLIDEALDYDSSYLIEERKDWASDQTWNARFKALTQSLSI